MHLIKENFRQNVETINRFKKAMCGKTKMRWKELFNFKAEFRGNVKNLGTLVKK